jgi:hypothetical protein
MYEFLTVFDDGNVDGSHTSHRLHLQRLFYYVVVCKEDIEFGIMLSCISSQLLSRMLNFTDIS